MRRALLSLMLLVGLIGLGGCKSDSESQSVSIELTIPLKKNSFTKILSYEQLEKGPWLCTIPGDTSKIQASLWAGPYIGHSVPSISIRYDFGDGVSGVARAMPELYASAYSDDAWLLVSVFHTSFLDSMREMYPDQFKNELHCSVLPISDHANP